MLPDTRAFTTYRALSQQHLGARLHRSPALQPELNDLSTPLNHELDHFKINPDAKKQLVRAGAAETDVERGSLNPI